MKQLKENEIINLFINSAFKDKALLCGIGDDTAVIKKSNTQYLLISKDVLVEDVHFKLSYWDPFMIANKAISSNLSDIAASGGTPLYILLGISCPKTTKFSWLKQFADGIKKICKRHKIILIGGDTTNSPDKIYLSITIIGEVKKANLKLRSTAKVGD